MYRTFVMKGIRNVPAHKIFISAFFANLTHPCATPISPGGSWVDLDWSLWTPICSRRSLILVDFMDSSGSQYKPLYPFVSFWNLTDPRGPWWNQLKISKCQKLFNYKLYSLVIPVLIFFWSGSYCETLEKLPINYIEVHFNCINDIRC